MSRLEASADRAEQRPRRRRRERRRHHRAPTTCRVILRDAHGRVLGRGRTCNVSEGGVHMVIPARCKALTAGAAVHVELTSPPRRPGGKARTVRYAATVLRCEPLGSWTGLAVEFTRKLP